VDMAAMLSGGQRLGLLSTTLNNTSSSLSSSAGINEFGNFEEHGIIEPNLADGGASQKSGIHSNNKSVVLVKLTDSALKAIAEYVKQRNHQLRNLPKSTKSDSPTINFFQQHGTISIPSLPKPGACLEGNRDGSESTPSRTFNFNISDTASDSGPQGSFECLQSSKIGSVDTLGSIQKKLQITGDGSAFTSFEKKLLAEKSDSGKRQTQLLNPKTGRGLVTTRAVVKHSFSNSLSSNSSKGTQNKPPSNDIHSSSFSNSHSRHSDRASESDHPPPFRNFNTGCVSPVPGSQLSANHPMLDRLGKGPYCPTNKQMTTEIMKRTLRDRIVHLLAVRPYKKPELMVRIHRDGVKEKEKKNIMGILGSVSEHKDNTYKLKRAFWNDVSEDWPFYTEEERQAFRRRKPQNLTPPGSDGGISVSSFGSGHSSSSSHPGSPQPTVNTSMSVARSPRINDSRGSEQPRDGYRGAAISSVNQSTSLLKRASPSAAFGSNGSAVVGSERGAYGIGNGHQPPLQNGVPPSKKKRVSNYKRPPDMHLSPGNNSGSLSDYGGRSPAFIGSTSIPVGRSPRNSSVRGITNGLVVPSRASPTSALQYSVGLSSNDHIIPSSESKTSEWLLSNGNNIGSINRLAGQQSPHKSPVVNVSDPNQHWNSLSPSPGGNDNIIVSDQNDMSYTNNYSQMSTLSSTEANSHIADDLDYMQKQCNIEMQLPMSNNCQNDRNVINESTVYTADTVDNSEFVHSNNDDNAKQFEEHLESPNEDEQSLQDANIMLHKKREYSPLPSSPRQFVGTDFRKEYIQIRDRDTRKRYKVEFGRNYDRYRELHCKIEKVSRRFADLELQLRRKPEGSDSYKRMVKQVQEEYQMTKGRPEFIAMRQEFEYLHEKMAHIKLLVQQFDKRK